MKQTTMSSRPKIVWLMVAFGALSVMAMVIGAPIARATDHGIFAVTIYQAFGVVCHQIPERSFFVAGHQFAVCARCTGLYTGFTLGLLLYPLLRSLKPTSAPPRKWLFLAMVPLVADLGVRFLGLWENTHSSRFVTGALLGVVAVFYVMPGVIDLSLRGWRSSFRANDAPALVASVASTNSVATREDLLPRFTKETGPSDYSQPHRRI